MPSGTFSYKRKTERVPVFIKDGIDTKSSLKEGEIRFMSKKWKRSFVTALSMALAVGNCVPAMAAPAGWTKDASGWRYVNSNGTVQKGWFQDTNKQWYFLDYNTGVMKTGWIKPKDGKWYFMDYHTGAMKTGWIKPMDGKWYYLDGASGEMKTGWVQTADKKWYYMDAASGAMKTGTVTVDNKVYTLDANGVWNGESGKSTTYVSTSSSSRGSSSGGSNITTTTNTKEGTGWKGTTTTSGKVDVTINSKSFTASTFESEFKDKFGAKEINNLTIEAALKEGENVEVKFSKATSVNNLKIDEAVGEGNVLLENLNIGGTTTISGGGESSIKFNNCTLKGKVTAKKSLASKKGLHIEFAGNTKIEGDVEVSGDSVKLTAINITIPKIIAKAEIKVEGATVKNFTIADVVKIILVQVTVEKVDNDAVKGKQVTINTDEATKLPELPTGVVATQTIPTVSTITATVSGSSIEGTVTDGKATITVTDSIVTGSAAKVTAWEATAKIKGEGDTTVEVPGKIEPTSSEVTIGNSVKLTFKPTDSKYDEVEIEVTIKKQ